MKKILLTEGASLTARETITTLRKSGYKIDVLSSEKFPLTAFSRWKNKIIVTVNANENPEQYLKHISRLLQSGDYLAVVPTHEQAWLLAEGKDFLPANPPIALASTTAFREVQGKVAFAKLADRLEIPVPRWELIKKEIPIGISYPYWIKADYGTAGRSVCKVRSKAEIDNAILLLSSDSGQLMAQEHISGKYGQVQAVFTHGKMIAVHTTIQQGIGAGGSAAARLSVDYPETREHVEKVGKYLNWHGCLTLDFMCNNGNFYYIECNPRMIEPANAAEAGLNFAEILINISSGKPLPDTVEVGRPGIKTHSIMALLLGMAERTGRRKKIVKMFLQSVTSSGFLKNSLEVLTPVSKDPLSAIPLLFILFLLLIDPKKTRGIALKAIGNYSIYPKTIDSIRSGYTI